MAPSSRRKQSVWAKQAVALAWGAWSELGVSGWEHTHGSWAVDPEPLIFLTAGLGDRDPRLRDEAADWCIQHWRFISRVRLRNLLSDQPEAVLDGYGAFAATVNEHAGLNWPGATEPWKRYRASGRSMLRPLEEPALVCLRARAMFGVSARAEILRHLLAHNGRGLTVARLAALAGYAKRNVAEECDMLERAGVLARRTDGNRFIYSLAHRAELHAFVGELPEVFPNWTALSSVVLALVALADAEAELSPDAFTVETHRILHDLGDALDELDLAGPPRQPKGAALWAEVKTWGDELLANLAVGCWPGVEEYRRVVSVSSAPARRRAQR
jgi:DNA-binding transcriptional ArsR family regulator